MIVFRLHLNLTLAVALAVVCPIRCQADVAKAITGEAAVVSSDCLCCPGETTETPEPPAPGECSNCVCDGAVDGQKVAAIELPPAVPGDLPATVGDLTRLLACALESLDAKPDAPDGATLGLLLASLLI